MDRNNEQLLEVEIPCAAPVIGPDGFSDIFKKWDGGSESATRLFFLLADGVYTADPVDCFNYFYRSSGDASYLSIISQLTGIGWYLEIYPDKRPRFGEFEAFIRNWAANNINPQ